MLKDNLRTAQMKALCLEKEKKLLLLSVSHDIKTPLNSIKLYAKVLEEGGYDTSQKQINAAKRIEQLSEEIEDFVKEIVKASIQLLQGRQCGGERWKRAWAVYPPEDYAENGRRNLCAAGSGWNEFSDGVFHVNGIRK